MTVSKRMPRTRPEPGGNLPDLSADQVLAWASAFFTRTGEWPNWQSGPIPESPGDTWFTVAAAMSVGERGFPRGGSLHRFIDEHRGPDIEPDPRFSKNQVLAWADAWKAQTGRRPTRESGEIPGSGGVTWSDVEHDLRTQRGVLPGGIALSQLLATERRVVRHPLVTEKKVLGWADAFHKRHGSWPTLNSGTIREAPHGRTWRSVDAALRKGRWYMPAGPSLRLLLKRARGVGRTHRRDPLALEELLAWGEAHHARTGKWPDTRSGPIPEAPGDTWRTIHLTLKTGGRGLPGGSSIAMLFAEQRALASIPGRIY